MLIVKLIQSMSVVILGAYIFSQSKIFRRFLLGESNLPSKLWAILFFVVISILSTYLGIEITSKAIATSRPIGVLAAGYLGGPFVGITTGLIVGIHRLFHGGFTATACGLATIIAGLIGSIGKYTFKLSNSYIKTSILLAIVAEVAHLSMVLLLAKPFANALLYVKATALPLLFINSLGLVVFMSIVNKSVEEERKTAALKSQLALSIAKETLIYMKQGFTHDTAMKIADIIKNSVAKDGVLIGNRDKVQYYTNTGIPITELQNHLKDFYQQLEPITEERLIEFNYEGKLNCFLCYPIHNDGSFEGVIALRLLSKKHADKYTSSFLKELCELLATQIQLYKLSKLAQEVTLAELKALRAQIHPHFLFNALSTISYFCRTDSEKARELIVKLSQFFRKTLEKEEDLVSLREELDLIEAYTSIEVARFGDRVKVNIDIPKELYLLKLPMFTLQPLVENSIKHGLTSTSEGGIVSISSETEEGYVTLIVRDTGIGMDCYEHCNIPSKSTGIGLQNVNNRLKYLYGKQAMLQIRSERNVGTEIKFKIPREAV